MGGNMPAHFHLTRSIFSIENDDIGAENTYFWDVYQ